MTVEKVAYDALNLANQNTRDIENHEAICAERYAGINKSIDELKSLIKTGMSWGFSILMAMLAFLLVEQFEDIKEQQDIPRIESSK